MGKIAENPSKWRPTLFYFNKWCTTFAEKRMKAFFGGHPKKVFHDLCGRKTLCRPKSYKNVTGKLGDFWAKILRNLQKLPASTLMLMQVCACLNYRKKMKPEPCRLIPWNHATNTQRLIAVFTKNTKSNFLQEFTVVTSYFGHSCWCYSKHARSYTPVL